MNFEPKFEFRPKIEFRAFYNFMPPKMIPAHLSNYGPSCGPRARPVSRPGTIQNSNETGLSGLGRAGQFECTPIFILQHGLGDLWRASHETSVIIHDSRQSREP